MRCTNATAKPTPAQRLTADAAALVDELHPLYVPSISRRVDQLLAAADRLAEQEAC